MELKLGEKQTLVIVKKVEFGVYLATKEAPEDKVLLPAKQVPAGANVGDEVEVFLYRDSSDRLIATTRTPKLIMGQVALLTVVQIGKVGAFLDWGLEKDLFLPFKQQTRKSKSRRSGAGFPLYRQKRQTLRDHECLRTAAHRQPL